MKKGQENKKIIGFDMDGVILDHTENKLLLAQKFNLSMYLKIPHLSERWGIKTPAMPELSRERKSQG